MEGRVVPGTPARSLVCSLAFQQPLSASVCVCAHTSMTVSVPAWFGGKGRRRRLFSKSTFAEAPHATSSARKNNSSTKTWQGLTPNVVQSRHRCRWSCCVLSLLSPVLLFSGWIVYPPGLRCTLSETRQLAHRGYAPPVVLYCIIYTSYYQTMSHMVPAAIPSCFKSGKPATSRPINLSTSLLVLSLIHI